MILMIAFLIFCGLVYAAWKFARRTGKDEPVEGAVFVTGCDSGMGECTAFHLAKVGYHVFAGVYMTESFKKYESFKNITPIQVDVASEESVANAAKEVTEKIENSKGAIKGLYGVLQCAGIAYTGMILKLVLDHSNWCMSLVTAPFEYIPMAAFKRQIDVNYYGYVYVAKTFLPIVKAYCLKPGARRGRFAFTSRSVGACGHASTLPSKLSLTSLLHGMVAALYPVLVFLSSHLTSERNVSRGMVPWPADI